MAVTVQRVIEWLPNSGEYDGSEESTDYSRLNTCLRVVVSNVGGRCRHLGEFLWLGIEPYYIDETTEEVIQPPTAEWPEEVQQAVVMYTCDLYASRQRPGAVDFGTYMPKNHEAMRLLSRYLVVF
jgi:hypothetical protein